MTTSILPNSIVSTLIGTVFVIVGAISSSLAGQQADGERNGSSSGPTNYTYKQLLFSSKRELLKINFKDRYTLDNQPNTTELTRELADALRHARKGTIRIINAVNRAKTPKERKKILDEFNKQLKRDFLIVREDVIRLREDARNSRGVPVPGSYAAIILWEAMLGEEAFLESAYAERVLTGEEKAWREADSRFGRLAFLSLFVEQWAKQPNVAIER